MCVYHQSFLLPIVAKVIVAWTSSFLHTACLDLYPYLSKSLVVSRFVAFMLQITKDQPCRNGNSSL